LLEPKLGQKSARQAQNLTIRHRKADEFNLWYPVNTTGQFAEISSTHKNDYLFEISLQ
jgi:hypothetical protein